jgi:hypothetical protein
MATVVASSLVNNQEDELGAASLSESAPEGKRLPPDMQGICQCVRGIFDRELGQQRLAQGMLLVGSGLFGGHGAHSPPVAVRGGALAGGGGPPLVSSAVACCLGLEPPSRLHAIGARTRFGEAACLPGMAVAFDNLRWIDRTLTVQIRYGRKTQPSPSYLLFGGNERWNPGRPASPVNDAPSFDIRNHQQLIYTSISSSI